MSTKGPSATQDSWATRIENIANALGTTPEYVEQTLLSFDYEPQSGLVSLDDDDATKFGDFREIFGLIGDKPTSLLKLRIAFKFAKGSKKAENRLSIDPRTAQLRALGYKTRLEDSSIETLLGLYDPSKPSDPITNALKKRYADKKVIAFNETGGVAVAQTVAYLSDLEQGFPEQEVLDIDGTLARLWPVGVVPDAQLDEDPLFPGSPLRSHRSIVNHRNWVKVELEARQLCRIILTRHDITATDAEAVLRLIERAEKGVNGLKEAYPLAELEFRDLKKAGDLPKLKMTFNQSRPNNPFNVNRKY